jgi:DnaJ domain
VDVYADRVNRPWRRTTLKGNNLARETDFLDLYKILGLDPGCGLAEFKQAYRRRVAVLHPDRRGEDGASAIAAERLQHLTAMYGAAMEFERQHGRLPGAPPLRHAPVEASPPPPAAAPSIAPPPQRRWRWLLIAAAALAFIAWLLWDSGWLPGNDEPEPATTSQQDPSDSRPADHHKSAPSLTVALGMDTDAVRAIEGEPMLVGENRWDYGPSWIRFENDKVVDWYSSPLRPLKTPSPHPAPTRDD